jgi:hypothetical protein
MVEGIYGDHPPIGEPDRSRVFIANGLILLGQERIIVAPQQEIYELACIYASQQRDFGNLKGRIVRALGDAYHLLDIEQSNFRPVH